MSISALPASVLSFALLAVTLGGRVMPMRVARALAALDRWGCGLTLRQCQVEGFSIPYLEGGAGEPLILIHGLGGQKEHFSHVAAELARKFHVFIPDLPGFGAASRNPQADYHIEAQAERIFAFADALALPRLHLGGNSMGGFIAAECAARRPDRVATLWLIGSAGVSGAKESETIREFRSTGEWPHLIREPADFDKLRHAVMAHPPFMPYALRWVLARRGVADYALHRRIARQVLAESPPLNQRYQQIATPTLIVWGSEDTVLDPSSVERFRKLFPHSELQLMEECGDVPMFEKPHEAAEGYMRFRAKLASSLPQTTESAALAPVQSTVNSRLSV